MPRYIVTITCTVKKQLTCEGCTEEEARENPYDYVVDELEIDQTDYEVEQVKEEKR